MKKSIFWPFLLDGNYRLVPVLNTRKLMHLLVFGLFLFSTANAFATIRYVKAGAAGNGSSWSSPSGDFQAMINASAAGDQVWVATGTYKPTTGTDRNISFSMKDGVAIYGGFQGMETLLNQRPVITYSQPSTSILSGDIGTLNNTADNSFHVILNIDNGLTNAAVVDGFVITGGNASGNGTTSDGWGGGMYSVGSSPTIRNCLFRNNNGYFGGAIEIEFGNPTFINCSFSNNSANYGGAASIGADNANFFNCIFTDNSGYGGAIENYSNNTKLVNCSFTGNIGSFGTVLASRFESNLTLVNCIVWGNGNGTSLVTENGGRYTISYSDIDQDGFAGQNSNIRKDPLFTNTANGDCHLQPNSPAINNGYNAANNTTTDLDGSPRKYGVIDMGAYEYQCDPITISSQLQNTTACLSSTATFTVGATGPNLYYEWYKDGQYSRINNNAATLTINNVSPSDAGNYTVKIFSSCGTVTTAPATLTVNSAPTISTQPTNATICEGGTATYTIAVGGTPAPSIQWQYSNNGGNNWYNSGNNSSTFSFMASQPINYKIRAIVSNNCGSVTSLVASLTVNSPSPEITSSPASATRCPGQTVSFSVASASPNLSYQWKKDEVIIEGATAATYTINAVKAEDAGQYRAWVTSGNCGTSPSDIAELTVNTPTSISTPPASVTKCAGEPVSFSVAATGTNLTYQWKKDGTNIAGAINATYSIASANAASAGNYNVVVSGACGSPITSNGAYLTVNPAPVITVQPVNVTTCVGVPYTLSVSATGTGVNYDWQLSTDGGSSWYSTSVNASSVTYSTVTANMNGRLFRVRVYNSCGSVTSDVVTLTVNELPAKPVITPNGSTSFCVGGSVTLTAPDGYAAYKWSNGETTQSVTVTSGGYYNVTGTNSSGCSSTSDNISVTSYGRPYAPVVTADSPATFCDGDSVILSTSSLSSYTWSNGATTQSITVKQSGSYSLTITNENGCTSSASNAIAVTVNPLPAPVITTDGPATICAGVSVNLTANDGYTSYAWSNGATTRSISVSAPGNYSVTVTNAAGCSATSAPANIKAYSSATIYVDGSVSASGDGSSWANAYQELRDALNAANSCSSITTIKVAAGTYKPVSYANPENAFVISRGGLKIYGGYPVAGGIRNAFANPTILSGDIGAQGVIFDNSYHVLVIAGLTNTADSVVIDGFTVTAGNATGTGSVVYNGIALDRNHGAAINAEQNTNGKLAFRNLIIANNAGGSGWGAAMVLNTSGAVLDNCIFYNNSTSGTGQGGALWNNSSTTAMNNCLLYNNYGAGLGGAIQLNGSNPLTLNNSTLYANRTNGNGGAIRSGAGSVLNINNSIFYKNDIGAQNGTYVAPGNDLTLVGTYTITNSMMQGAAANYSNAANSVFGADPLFTNETDAAGADGIFGTADDGLRLSCSSPAINKGNNSVISGIPADITGANRIQSSIVDMGAYESPYSMPATPSVTIAANPGTAFCAGTTVTFTATPVNGGSNPQYQWTKNGINVGTNDATFTASDLSDKDAITVQLTSNAGCINTPTASNTVAVTVNALPAKPVIASGGFTTFCTGGSVTLTAPDGYTYAWSNHETTKSITINQAGSYSVTVTNTSGCSSTSNAIIVTINIPPAVTSSPADVTVCDGDFASFSTVVSGTPVPDVLWQISGDGGNSFVTLLETDTSFSAKFSSGQNGYKVRAYVTNSCGAVTSGMATVTVNTPASITTSPVSTTKCAGQPVSFSVAATGSNLNYQWKKDGTNIGGATLTTYSIAAATTANAGQYSVEVSGSCGSPVTSDAATLTVSTPAKPAITTNGSTTICTGSSVTLTAPLSNTYAWSDGETTQSINVSQSGSYTVTVSNASGCSSPASTALTVTVNPLPAKPVITAGGPTTFYDGGSVTLSAPASSSYLWSTTETTQSIVAATSGNYTVTVSNAAGCSAASDAVAVTVKDKPVIDTLSPVADAYVRNGDYATLNYGADTALGVKTSNTKGFSRNTYLKFSLGNVGSVASAKLRIYGSNISSTAVVNALLYPVVNDSWTESGINWNNAPAASSTTALGFAAVDNQKKYYDINVTDFVKSQFADDKVISLQLRDPHNNNLALSFNSREYGANMPQLIVENEDQIAPYVEIKLVGSVTSPSNYNNQVKIVVVASDKGGSGLALTEYSLNGAAYVKYDTAIVINTAGSYTVTARATDGHGNVKTTEVTSFNVIVPQALLTDTLAPVADASVRSDGYAGINYGHDSTFWVKGSNTKSYSRNAYLKFSLMNSISSVSSAKLRIYGYNADTAASVTATVLPVTNDTWYESEINWNNAPKASSSNPLGAVAVSKTPQYYDVDVTAFVKGQFAGDKIVTFLLKDLLKTNSGMIFNSRENAQNQPRLIITAGSGSSNSAAITSIARPSTVQPQPAEEKLSLTAYPNPSTVSFKLTVGSSNLKDRIAVAIFDEGGRMMETRLVNAGETLVLGDRYRAGVYFAQAIQAGKRVNVKIIKQAW